MAFRFVFTATLLALANADCPCSYKPLFVQDRDLSIRDAQAQVLDIMSNFYQNATQIVEIAGLNVEHVGSDYYKVDELDKCFVATVKNLIANVDGDYYKVNLRMKGEALESGFRNTVCECHQEGPLYHYKPRYSRHAPGPQVPVHAHPHAAPYADPYNPYAYAPSPYAPHPGPYAPAPYVPAPSYKPVIDICEEIIKNGIGERLDDIKCQLEKNCYTYYGYHPHHA